LSFSTLLRTYHGYPACIRDDVEVEKISNPIHILRPIQFDNENTLGLIPLKDNVGKKCLKEVSQLYCNESSFNTSIMECNKKLNANDINDNYCLKNPQLCWEKARIDGSCYSDVNRCKYNPGDCGWYIGCLQNRFKCQYDDYPLGYGLRYCRKFNNHYQEFDEDGKKFVTLVTRCLQSQLIPYWTQGNLTCQELQEIAFKTHPYCYLNVSPNFCDIALNNIITLLKIYDIGDLISWEAIKQEIEILDRCALDVKPVLRFKRN